jgi:hypothetical protein
MNTDKDKILEILNSFEDGACIVVTFYDTDFVIMYEGIKDDSLIIRKGGVWNKGLGLKDSAYRASGKVLCSIESVQNVREATCEEAAILKYYIKNY